MQTETLQLASVGSPDQWSAAGIGPPTKIEAVAPPDDGDNTYITAAGAGSEQQFIIAPPVGIAAADVIHAVSLRTRARRSVFGSRISVQLALAGDALVPASFDLGSSYEDVVHVFPTRPDGQAWTLDDLTGDLRITYRQGSGEDARLTTAEPAVVFTPTGAGPMEERIATALQARLESISIAGGYSLDVVGVERPAQYERTRYQDRRIILSQRDPEQPEERSREGNSPATEYFLPFEIECPVRQSAREDDEPLDRRLNLFRADVIRAVMIDPQLGGLVTDTRIIGWEDTLSIDASHAATVVVAQVYYAVQEDDHYVNRS